MSEIQSMAKLAEELLAKQRAKMPKTTGSDSSESTSERFRDRGLTEDVACPRCGLRTKKPVGLDVPLLCGYCRENDRLAAFRGGMVHRRMTAVGLLRGSVAHMRLATFDLTESRHRNAYDVVTTWLDGYPYGLGESVLLWSSGFGAGKTHLARAVQRAVFELGGIPSFWLMADMLAAIRASYDHRELDSEHSIVGRMGYSELLIWDDLGKEYVSDRGLPWFQNLVFRVLDRRYQKGCSVFVTSNLSPEDLGQLLGGASASRLWEMVGDRVVDMTGPDWRMK